MWQRAGRRAWRRARRRRARRRRRRGRGCTTARDASCERHARVRTAIENDVASVIGWHGHSYRAARADEAGRGARDPAGRDAARGSHAKGVRTADARGDEDVRVAGLERARQAWRVRVVGRAEAASRDAVGQRLLQSTTRWGRRRCDRLGLGLCQIEWPVAIDAERGLWWWRKWRRKRWRRWRW